MKVAAKQDYQSSKSLKVFVRCPQRHWPLTKKSCFFPFFKKLNTAQLQDNVHIFNRIRLCTTTKSSAKQCTPIFINGSSSSIASLQHIKDTCTHNLHPCQR